MICDYIFRGISLLKILQTAALFEGLMRKRHRYSKEEEEEEEEEEERAVRVEVCMEQFVWCVSVSPEWGCAWSYTRVVECWCGRALLLWLGTGVVEGAGTGG